MRTLIDGDVLRYELGNVAQSVEEMFGTKVMKPWSDSRVQELVENRIETIVRRTDATGFEVFLSAGSNYRYDIAVTNPYKGQRSGVKPHHWRTVGDILTETYGAYHVHGAEADDVLSIFARLDPEEVCIASRDKDLRIVPCWHYSWKCGEAQPEVEMNKVDLMGSIGTKKYNSGGHKLIGSGLRFFYGQVLCGDEIDNYKGCPSVGPVKACEILLGADTEEELWERTYWAYVAKLGEEEGLRLLIENAQLAWLLSEAEVTEDANNLYVSPRSLWQPPAAIPARFS